MQTQLRSSHWRPFAAIFVTLAAASCTTLQQIANDSPPAKTPVLKSLQAAPSATGAFADIAMDNNWTPGAFQAISPAVPVGLPRGAVKVFFTAPSLLMTLKVDVEGVVLYKYDEVPAGLDRNVVGWYRVENVDASDDTWQVTIRPPSSSIPRYALTINIATVSTNPKYSGTEHESAPLVLKLAARGFVFAMDAHGFVSAACVLLPNFPFLRAGLTVASYDTFANWMTMDCCAPFTPYINATGELGSVAPASFPFPGKRRYSLVLRIGTQTQQGAGGITEQFVTNQAGALEVCINDDNLGDNDGQWGVVIRVSE